MYTDSVATTSSEANCNVNLIGCLVFIYFRTKLFSLFITFYCNLFVGASANIVRMS